VVLSLSPVALDAAELQPSENGWPKGYARISVAETAVIGGLGLGALVLELAVTPSSTPRWSGPILDGDCAATEPIRSSSQPE
jgi:hypothetical protein